MCGPPLPAFSSATAMLLRGIREAINLGSFDMAETLCAEVLVLEPANAQAQLLMGRVKYIKKDFAAAKSFLSLALKALPREAPAWMQLARCHVKSQDWQSAIACMRSAFAITPATAVEEAELGHYYKNNGDIEEAAECFSRGVVLDPNNVDLWNDLGSMQVELNDLKTAERTFDIALSLNFNALEPTRNRALIEELRGNAAEALTLYDRLVKVHPTDVAGRQKRGVTRLAHGQLVDGWIDYRARFVNPAHKGWHGGIPKPRWEGGVKPLKERGLLVWSDQGLGDQILVANLLPDAIAAARNVVFACEPRLVPLIKRSFPEVRAVSLMDIPYGRVNLDDVDVQASISEIGPLFRADFEAFPHHAGYLKADPARVAALKARYAALPGQGPIVGLSWHSISTLAGDDKSVPLEQWTPILKTPGVRFVSLQYGAAAEDAKQFPNIFVDPEVDAVADVDLFAAQVAAMDRVISTSNTTVHMAGALNVPTLCLTPMVEGRPWYWFVGREVSPWYPSVHLVWQTKRRTWDDVIARAAENLMARA